MLDEADRMLDMGFSDDIMKIISYMPAERQTIMFSATLPRKIRELAKTILRNPAEVNIAISKPNEAIDQSAYICYERQKPGHHPRAVRRADRLEDDHLLVVETSRSRSWPIRSSAMKLDVAPMHSDLGSGEARAGDARF